MSKHTPGPWRALQVNDWYLTPVTNCGWGIVAVDPMRGRIDSSIQGMSQANAHLIAAAPEMYEALKAMANENYCDDCDCNSCKRARAAIAKAEGKA